MKMKFLMLFLLLSQFCFSQANNSIKLNLVTRGLSIPVFLTHAGDSRLFVIEKQGRIRIIEDGVLSPKQFLNIVPRVNSRGNEQGLLGLAFHPNYKSNGLFYVNYSELNTGHTIISEFKLSTGDPDKADSLSERIILKIQQPYSNHNGGCMHFGKDGYLYVGMGDGGSGGDPQNYAQNTKSLLGKMLRLDIDTSAAYKIPSDNPYVNSTDYLPEIWSTGLRNPWRFSFDRLNGDMWIGDVGQGEWEEVDFQPFNSKGGENYGWRCYEGDVPYNTGGCQPSSEYDFPVHVYKSDDTDLGCSVTGGYVYRENPASYLYGKYIYGDYCSGWIWAINKISDTVFTNETIFKFNRSQIASFGEDVNGGLYMTAIAEGAIYRITDTCGLVLRDAVWEPSCFNKKDGVIDILNSGSGFQYLWSTGDSTSRIENLGAGAYTLTLTQGMCRVEKTYTLKAPEARVACLTPIFRSVICEGDSAVLIACDEPIGTEYRWYRDSVLLQFEKGKRIFAKISGKYHVQTVDSLACISNPSSVIEITVHPLPDKPVLSFSGDSLLGPSGFISYRWFLNGQLLGGSTDPIFVINQKGSYQLSVIDSNNCESPLSDSLFLIPSFVEDPAVHFYKIYPNPSSAVFQLELDGRMKFPLGAKMLDSRGVQIRQWTIQKSGTETLDLSSYAAGMYFLSISTQDRTKEHWIRLIKL